MPSGKIKQRERLLREQGGRCYYCNRLLCAGTRELLPITEHFIPRSRGGFGKDSHKVVACHWCDSHKGMMTGYEWTVLLLKHTVGLTFNQAKAAICREAKAINTRLQNEAATKRRCPKFIGFQEGVT